jgi:hypothetical protein
MYMDLVYLASLSRLRQLELRGQLPTPDEIRDVPRRVLAPFPQLAEIALGGRANTIFALLDVFRGTSSNRLHLRIEFYDQASVDPTPITRKYGNGFLLGHCPPLTWLHILLPDVMCVDREHIPALTVLPPYLRQFVFDTRDKKADMPAITDMIDFDVERLLVSQPRLRTFRLVIWAPYLTFASLVSLGLHCQHLSDAWVGGQFDLNGLADIEEPLFPELRRLVIDCTAPIHAEESRMYSMDYIPGVQTRLRSIPFTSIRTDAPAENVPSPEDSESDDSVDEDDIWADAPEYVTQLTPFVDRSPEVLESARTTLRTIMRHAPRLEHLELIDKHGVNGAINAMWAAMH